MTIISRYLIRAFIAPFAFSLLLFIIFFLVADLFELLKAAWQNHAPAALIVTYLARQLPLTAHRMLPVAALLGSYLCFSGLAKTSELTALRAAGLPDRRLWRPLLLVVLAVVALDVWFVLHHEGSFTRSARATRRELRGETAGDTGSVRNFSFVDGRIHLLAAKISPGGILLRDVTWNEHYPGGPPRLRVNAPEAVVGSTGVLEFRRAELRYFTVAQTQDRYETSACWLPPRPLHPDVLWTLAGRTEETASFLSLPDLARFVGLLRTNGYDARRELIALHARLAYPFIAAAFALLGMSFNPVGRKANAALGFFLALVISLVFWIIVGLSTVIGTQGYVTPWLAGWLPLALIIPVIVAVYRHTRRV